MLKVTEIKQFIDEDKTSVKKSKAQKGINYYNAEHDIRDYQIFYFNDAGEAVEDETRSNIKISHPFFTELVDQCSQYLLSTKDRYVKSDNNALQLELDTYFDDELKMELMELVTYTQVEGDSFLYRYIDEDFKTRFKFADGMNVVEVPAKYASDKQDHVIYYYMDKKEKDKTIYRVQVWDNKQIYYYVMVDGNIKLDKDVKRNPDFHVIYKENEKTFYDTFNDVPFLRLDNNRRRVGALPVIKDLIDDYDLMACGISNNLQDVAEGIYVVKGWNGTNLDELTRNIKVKKQVAVGDGGDVDIKTINVPYQARLAKMIENEKNIYRFGMGFNTAQMGDGNVTNVVIRSRYALLDLKCNKLEAQLKKLMKKMIKIVIDEINKNNGTNYSYKDAWCEFTREVMTNAMDNAQIAQVQAQTAQLKVNTFMGIASQIGSDELLERLCEVLDLDHEDIKAKLKTNAPIDLNQASEDLMNIEVEDEESTQGNGTDSTEE